jgi:hypothetical protein
MSTPNSNTPGLYEGTGLALDQGLANVHTCTPAYVVSYDESTQTATVQPTLQRVYVGQAPVDLPQILQVPVVFPRVANAWLRLPIAKGDLVELRFSERSLDAWSQSDGATPLDPGIPHRFHLSDAIATPGLYPQGQAIQALGAQTSVELSNAGAWLEITSAGKFKLANGTAELFQTLQSLVNHLIGLTSINCVVGAPVTLNPATIAQLQDDLTNLEALS